jgi:hypothetical protein
MWGAWEDRHPGISRPGWDRSAAAMKFEWIRSTRECPNGRYQA